jgi:hypothetical protein
MTVSASGKTQASYIRPIPAPQTSIEPQLSALRLTPKPPTEQVAAAQQKLSQPPTYTDKASLDLATKYKLHVIPGGRTVPIRAPKKANKYPNPPGWEDLPKRP